MEKQVRAGLIQAVRTELSHLPLTDKKLREFALLVGGVMAALSLFWFWKGRPYWMWPLLPASQLLYFGLLWPKMLKPLYLAWMSLALVMGYVMTRVILSAFFYIVVTPLGWLVRNTGGLKNFQRKSKSSPKSYWIAREPVAQGAGRYEKQF